MPTFLTPSDLEPFRVIDQAKADAMIADITAVALEEVPALASITDAGKITAARAVLRGAVLRWADAGSGALSQTSQQAPLGFMVSESVDTRATHSGRLWPSEIKALQRIAGVTTDGAFAVDTVDLWDPHVSVCALKRGGARCTCGVILLDWAW